MNYKEILEQQEKLRKQQVKVQTGLSNLNIDMEAIKQDLIKTLEAKGYQNVKELLA